MKHIRLRKLNEGEKLNYGFDFVGNHERQVNVPPFKPTAGPDAEFEKREIHPGDMVRLKGDKYSVQSVLEGGDLVLLSPAGFTVECPASSVELEGNDKESLKAPFKFDKTSLKLLDEQRIIGDKMVPCMVVYKGFPMLDEKLWVKFRDWYDAKDRQTIKVINEDSKEYEFPRGEVNINALPAPILEPDTDTIDTGDEPKDVPEDTLEGEDKPLIAEPEEVKSIDGLNPKWQYGVEISSEGAPVRKLLIDSESFANAQQDADEVKVLFITDTGYKAGSIPKKLLSPVLSK